MPHGTAKNSTKITKPPHHNMQTTLESLVCTRQQSEALLTKYKPKTLFAWYSKNDQFGTLWHLDENMGGGIPAFTASELMAEIKPGWLQRSILAFTTGMDPKLLAHYLIKRRGL